ncbi:hypothetical protein SLEP1_g36433 [Rubroshorea leprosula]|uniref:Malectin-like domain-containing protein n=1 Tax=Rubroshorea leprosula TaxID=152421 RepID=A0AAV5KRH0_9ROSI|nr:hypothetical protein SLEP1_g36433 [Rubroshorea leprosula]
MEAGKTQVFKPWAVFILAILMAGLCAGHDKHIEPRKLASTTDRPGSISIDCGVSEDYPDEQSGIHYKSDSNFVTAGENKQVLPRYIPTHPQLGKMLNTLRSFPNGKKNCYNLKPEMGKGYNYMIRGFFFYGNYDGQNKPPAFDVYLGVNYWLTVNFSDDTTFYYNEIIQFLWTDTINVCLLNTDFGIPIISGLELRFLNNSIYQIESKSKVLRAVRYDMITNTSVSRYKDDVYDRLWRHYSIPEAKIIEGNANIDIQASNNIYEIPMEVLNTAAQPPSRLDSLNYLFNASYFHRGSLSWSSRDLYVYFHLAEIVNTTKDQQREISITLNGVKLPPITLEYLKPQSIGPQIFPVKGIANISIEATAESTLPPLLNAFEIYEVHNLLTSPTNTVDGTKFYYYYFIFKSN